MFMAFGLLYVSTCCIRLPLQCVRLIPSYSPWKLRFAYGFSVIKWFPVRENFFPTTIALFFQTCGNNWWQETGMKCFHLGDVKTYCGLEALWPFLNGSEGLAIWYKRAYIILQRKCEGGRVSHGPLVLIIMFMTRPYCIYFIYFIIAFILIRTLKCSWVPETMYFHTFNWYWTTFVWIYKFSKLILNEFIFNMVVTISLNVFHFITSRSQTVMLHLSLNCICAHNTSHIWLSAFWKCARSSSSCLTSPIANPCNSVGCWVAQSGLAFQSLNITGLELRL